jgi:hypothetical protein
MSSPWKKGGVLSTPVHPAERRVNERSAAIATFALIVIPQINCPR